MMMLARNIGPDEPLSGEEAEELLAAETMRRLESLLATVERLSPQAVARSKVRDRLERVIAMAEELEREHLPLGNLLLCATARDVRHAAEELLGR
jgi:hypothetical protein